MGDSGIQYISVWQSHERQWQMSQHMKTERRLKIHKCLWARYYRQRNIIEYPSLHREVLVRLSGKLRHLEAAMRESALVTTS